MNVLMVENMYERNSLAIRIIAHKLQNRLIFLRVATYKHGGHFKSDRGCYENMDYIVDRNYNYFFCLANFLVRHFVAWHLSLALALSVKCDMYVYISPGNYFMDAPPL